MTVSTLLGLAAAVLGCVGLYSASPNQRLWGAPWARRPARISGVVLLAVAWWAFAQAMHRLTASFLLGTLLMLVLALLPYAGALSDARRKR
jgi:hypothetical protein